MFHSTVLDKFKITCSILGTPEKKSKMGAREEQENKCILLFEAITEEIPFGCPLFFSEKAPYLENEAF